MKKKVTLDILDIEEPEVVPTQDEISDAGPPAEEPPLTSPRPWYRSRIFLVSGAVFLLLCLAGSLGYFFMGKKKAEQRTPAIAAPAAAPATVNTPGAAHTGAGQSTSPEKSAVHGSAPAVPGIAADTKAAPRPSVPVSVSLKDFLIPLRRVGKDRPVLSLDVTIQIDSNDQELIKENLAIVRGGVYKALFGIPEGIPKGNRGMEKIREKIIQELDVSLGPGCVKNVWFPKFVVL